MGGAWIVTTDTLAARAQRSYDQTEQTNAPAALTRPGAGHGGISSMSTSKANAGPADRHTRHKTRHRGITYRLLADGSRTYSVYVKGRYVQVEGGEREALALQADLRGKVARGERVTPAKVTFADVAEEWFESKRKLRPWTRKGYRDSLDRILLSRFGSMRISAIGADDVAKLIRDLEAQGLAGKTIENYLLPLSGTMRFAVRRGLIAANPCTLLTNDERPHHAPRKEKHVWSDEEIAALLSASEQIARQPESRYDYTPLIRTAIYTGLRLGELLGLQWQDIDLQDGAMHVRRQWTRSNEYGPTKTTAGVRRVPLPKELVQFFAELKLGSEHPDDEDPVFASREGTPLGHRNVGRRGFEPAAALAEINDVTFHDTRHAFASRMIARGIEPVTLAKLMGHEDIRETLNTYSHLWDRTRTDDLVREAMSLPSLAAVRASRLESVE
jgi:integrase